MDKPIRLWLVDAFSERAFAGATTGVAPVEEWPADSLMRQIAAENGCTETAFFKSIGLKGNYELRCFTAEGEIALGGHATLAAGAVLLSEVEPELDMAVFDTASGPLVVRKGAAPGEFTLDLPKRPRAAWEPPAALAHALGGVNFEDAFVGEYANVVLPSEDAVRNLKPDIEAIAKLVRGPKAGCLAVTARADEGKPYDFVSRFFAPGAGLAEDPVTGSSFADLAPYWCDRLGQAEVRGLQASARGGQARMRQTLSSVRLFAPTAVYLRGELDEAIGAKPPAPVEVVRLPAPQPVLDAPFAVIAEPAPAAAPGPAFDEAAEILVFDLDAPTEEGGEVVRVLELPPALQ
ncbi:MAG: PhzF family phenazine biosynthesis protein [Hyphomonadaceae bacterium]